jgi:hypothetical protein
MSTCVVCGNTIAGEGGITIEKNGETQSFCCPNCLFESNAFDGYKHRSLSSLVLNKTLFEVLAILTGFGGVYYTIFDVAKRALIMDTISVATALAAIFIGVEHLRYVEEHNLVKRAVIFLSIITITGFALIVWHYGLKT